MTGCMIDSQIGGQSKIEVQQVSELPFHLLRARYSGDAQTLEYEFMNGGKLVSYTITKDGSESGTDTPIIGFSPRFTVEWLKWRLRDNTLFLTRGDQEIKINYEDWHRSDGVVLIGESVFHKVDNLQFFDELRAFRGK